jgi:hypothetical protein
MNNSTVNGLAIVELEINRLMQKANNLGLDLSETKQLEILVKIRQLLIGEPTDITKTVPSNKEEVSDSDILAALKPQNRGNSEAGKKKKKTAPRPN